MLSMRHGSVIGQGRSGSVLMEAKKPISEEIDTRFLRYPEIGPDLLLLSRKEVDELYDLFETLVLALEELKIEYIVIGGSLLGSVRSKSILFNDDDIDIAIINIDNSYNRLKEYLPKHLRRASHERTSQNTNDKKVDYLYQNRPWVACDRVKSTAAPRVWIDIFVIQRYESLSDLVRVVERNDNGQNQPKEFMDRTISALGGADFPLYHYDNYEAIKLRPREYFRPIELLPTKEMAFGHLTVQGPRDSIGTLRRFFGKDCFTHYTVVKHTSGKKPNESAWQQSERKPLSEGQHMPVQHSRREKRIWSDHSRKSLEATLADYDASQVPVQEKPTTPPSSGLPRIRSIFSIGALAQPVESFSHPPPSTKREDKSPLEPEPTKWFGQDVRKYTKDNPDVPVFDQGLRTMMEPHVAKARKKREEFRNPLDVEIEDSLANAVGVPYTSLRDERRFLFDEHSYPMHKVLAETLGVNDLSKIHEHDIHDKRQLMARLLEQSSRRAFHECYENFVISFCIPLLHSLALTKNLFHTTSVMASTKIVYRYQAFPCIRVVRPGEFSIGPHCDIAYGHSIGNINFHIPLTPVFGTNALYTESHPGREDWHPLVTKSVGLGYLFDGARCVHFSLENTTPATRVSLDFRIAIYRKGSTSAPFDGSLCTKGILEDRYWRAGAGYYDEAVIDLQIGSPSFPGATVAKKVGTRLYDPDERNGFPFTKK